MPDYLRSYAGTASRVALKARSILGLSWLSSGYSCSAIYRFTVIGTLQNSVLLTAYICSVTIPSFVLIGQTCVEKSEQTVQKQAKLHPGLVRIMHFQCRNGGSLALKDESTIIEGVFTPDDRHRDHGGSCCGHSRACTIATILLRSMFLGLREVSRRTTSPRRAFGHRGFAIRSLWSHVVDPASGQVACKVRV